MELAGVYDLSDEYNTFSGEADVAFRTPSLGPLVYFPL